MEGGGRIEEDDIVFPPLWSLFGGDIIVEGHVIFGCPAGLECDSKHQISAAKSILDFVTCTRVILCC